jgi:hypothetical protein
MENNQIVQIMKDSADLIETQRELIDVLYTQMIDLSLMSKIELGDDVIVEIRRLKDKISKIENQ